MQIYFRQVIRYKKRDRSELKMLDIAVIGVLSVFFEVGWFGAFLAYGFLTRKRKDLGLVKASKPAGFILHKVWSLLPIVLIIVFLLGAAVPDWLYGTILNVSFSGAEYLQVASVLIFLVGVLSFLWSAWTLRSLMRPRIVVMERQELVTKGPYSRVRHPVYTGAMLLFLAPVLLYLNLVLVLLFFICVGLAYRRAVLEDELLASENGFGQAYRDYMQKTGRFLPKLIR
jgi:protein-S-isoprenylcysteine O-methyltransferase Ste14